MPKPSDILVNKFDHQPTKGQLLTFERLNQFIESKKEKEVFVLTGYAGTGKTSLLSALVKVLPLFNYKFVLLAPTGRAAKVMSQFTKRTAFTIHKKIYKTKGATDKGGLEFSNTKNYQSNTIFIVDEASMIGVQSDRKNKSLLNDLIKYVFEKDGNKLMLIGDTAQLPPVHQTESKALDGDYLKDLYGLNVSGSVLTEITRQAAQSGILQNATSLRNTLLQKDISVKFSTQTFSDIFRMNGEKLEDGLRYAYEKFGMENTLTRAESKEVLPVPAYPVNTKTSFSFLLSMN